MQKNPLDDEDIFAELVALSKTEAGKGLLQFRNLASAHQYKSFYKLFRRYVLPQSKVLDWGTGNGHFSYFLGRAGYILPPDSLLKNFPLNPGLEIQSTYFIKEIPHL